MGASVFDYTMLPLDNTIQMLCYVLAEENYSPPNPASSLIRPLREVTTFEISCLLVAGTVS